MFCGTFLFVSCFCLGWEVGSGWDAWLGCWLAWGGVVRAVGGWAAWWLLLWLWDCGGVYARMDGRDRARKGGWVRDTGEVVLCSRVGRGGLGWRLSWWCSFG